MASSVRTLQIHTVSSSQVKIPNLHFVSSLKHHISSNASAGLGTPQFLVFSHRQTTLQKFVLLRPTFCSLSNDGGGNAEIDSDKAPAAATIHTTKRGARFDLQAVGRFKESVVASFPRVSTLMKRNNGLNPAIGLCVAMALLFVSIRLYVVRKSRYRSPGSVADLVRRGQLRSDRRGISLKYEDPFNNPLVKVAKSNSSVEMCGKTYRLAPVTLTKEQQAIHQKRRSRAYQWKRPTMFLKEGDSIPPDVDPDTIRWIPANHPFATTATDIDEDMAQNNVYQKHGVPFRIQAEHEALQRKLEVLQSEEKLNKMVIDPANAKDFERPFKTNSRSYDAVEKNPTSNQVENLNERKSDHPPNSFGNS